MGLNSGDSTALSLLTQQTCAVILDGEDRKGTCHKCGGNLSRGHNTLAMQCGGCGTRFHGSDCGGRLADAGNLDWHDKCPKVRARLRRTLRVIGSRGFGAKALPSFYSQATLLRWVIPFEYSRRLLTLPSPLFPASHAFLARIKCSGVCLCVGGACACHATNVRRKRQLTAGLRDVVHKRSLEIRNAAYRGEEPPPVSTNTLAAVELVKLQRMAAGNDAMVTETGGPAKKQDTKDTKAFDAAVEAWQKTKQTLAADDDAYLMNVLVDYDALRDDNNSLKMQNEALRLQNEKLQLEVTALRLAVGSKSKPSVNIAEVAEKFVQDPEMRRGGLMELYHKHIDFSDTGVPEPSALVGRDYSAKTRLRFENQNQTKTDGFDKRNMNLAAFGADVQSLAPGPACETTDFGSRTVRNVRYFGRFIALLAVLALFSISMYNMNVYSTRIYCDNDDAHLNAALRSGITVASFLILNMDGSCHDKAHATMAVFAVLLIVWHVLCIEAWLGFRFCRALILMWRWDAKSKRAAEKNAKLAREEALGSEADWEKNNVEIVIDDTGSDSGQSEFNDSAQGDN